MKMPIVLVFMLMYSSHLWGALPPPGSVAIKKLIYAGPGCPLGSVTAGMPTVDTIDVNFEQFQTRIVDSNADQTKRQYCVLTIGLSYPSNFRYTLGGLNYQVVWELDTQLKGTLKSVSYLEAYPTYEFQSHVFSPENAWYDEANVSQSVPVSKQFYPPCGYDRSINLKPELSIYTGPNPVGYGQGTLTSLRLKLNWQACTP